jgi:hypothetical protein
MKVAARKNDQDKPPMDLLPPGPLFELAKLYAHGATKYAPYNWRKGMEWSRVYAALLRHVMIWWDGESIDPEFGLSHLVHALWNAITLVCYELEGLGTDDRPKKQGE